MEKAIVVKGRLVNLTTVELEEPVSNLDKDIEIIIRPRTQDRFEEEETVFYFLRRIPPGTRTKEDVDRQIREERDCWGDN